MLPGVLVKYNNMSGSFSQVQCNLTRWSSKVHYNVTHCSSQVVDCLKVIVIWQVFQHRMASDISAREISAYFFNKSTANFRVSVAFNLTITWEILFIVFLFRFEVEFEFTTWAWVQATAGTVMGGGFPVPSSGP